MADPVDERPIRALAYAIAAMTVVALLVGGSIAAVARYAVGGLNESAANAGASDEETLVLPKLEKTGEPAAASQAPQTPKPEKSPRADKITLFIAPQVAAPGDELNFNGVYIDGDGVALRIQRLENGSWIDFPVEARVNAGAFDTTVITSRAGTLRWRMFDPTTERISNVVKVTLG